MITNYRRLSRILLLIGSLILRPELQARPLPLAGVALVKEFEGLYLQSYQDLGGTWTICWGATGPDIVRGLFVTESWCEKRLQEELEDASRGLKTLVMVPLSEEQDAALLSFVYHRGITTLSKSELLVELNAGRYLSAAAHFHDYDTYKGKVQAGFVRRREAERILFLTKQ